MINSDLLRQFFFIGVGVTFVTFSLWALFRPESLASLLGYKLTKPNGYSEFSAIYVGIFIAQSVLCALAFFRVHDAIIGDLVGVFLLAQPIGRLAPLLRFGMPTGILRFLFVLEILGAIAIFMVRPNL